MEETNQILHKTGEKLGETFEHVCRTTKQASEKVQSCFDARLASMIVGIIMSMIFGLGVVGCILALVYVGVITSFGYDLYADRQYPEGEIRVYEVTNLMLINATVTFALIFSLMEFSFSIVLSHGAAQRMTGHLHAYYIYANVKTVLLFIISIIVYSLLLDNTPGSLCLLGTALNIALTIMVRMAYKNIKESTKGYDKFDDETPVKQ